jgi:hypothetical protein
MTTELEHASYYLKQSQDLLATFNWYAGVLVDKVPCKQFQNIMMDLQSIHNHLEDFTLNGPKTPYVDIPLEASEISPDEMTNEDYEEYAMTGRLP